tara:strand:+ start:322 stop:489 length:168 start_codon:yes stop_codon:yes gene_type:complete
MFVEKSLRYHTPGHMGGGGEGGGGVEGGTHRGSLQTALYTAPLLEERGLAESFSK